MYLFFNDTATTEIYTLSLHDALPIFFACPAGGSCESSRWFLHARQVVQACPTGGSVVSSRCFRRVRHMVVARLRGGSTSPAGDSGVSSKWFWHSRLEILAWPAGGSCESSRLFRRAQQVFQMGPSGGSGLSNRR